MTTLSEFLLARIAEDEAHVALVETVPPKWTMTVYPHDGERIPVDVPALTPARALAECEAKRRIVDGFADVVEQGGDGDHRLGQVFRLLALPYVEHPDYDAEWKP